MFMQFFRTAIIGTSLLLSFNFAAQMPGGGGGNTTPTTQTPQSTVCDSIGGCDTGGGLSGVIKLVVNILSVLAGTLAVIMIILAGMKYITAAGDSSKITSAKNTLVYAIIGIVIVVLAQFIVQFVIGKTSSAVQCPAGKTYDNATSTCK